MGLCSSSAQTPEDRNAKAQSKKIEREMNQAREQDQKDIKLLLLGAGESGKSTIFKQMKVIHQSGYTAEESKTFVPIIHNNTISSMKVLLTHVERLQHELQPQNMPSAEFIGMSTDKGISVDAELTPEIAEHIEALWRDTGVQATYEMRSKFQLNDSAAYYFNKVKELAKKDYLPSEQDILRSRVRTTGIVETQFEIEGVVFRMFDVGGQRNERKKWIHCFENVTAVMFVAALSEYDQVLYEDETQNRMTEALNLFEEICKSRWFTETSIILFLNKRDLFADKIQKVDLRVCFPDYQGGHNYEEGTRFIQHQFELRNNNPEKEIYTHITCATDKGNVSHVFNACKDIILRRNLQGSGFMS